MGNFIKRFAKLQKNKVSLFIHLYGLASSSINIISSVRQDIFSLENKLQDGRYFLKMFVRQWF